MIRNMKNKNWAITEGGPMEILNNIPNLAIAEQVIKQACTLTYAFYSHNLNCLLVISEYFYSRILYIHAQKGGYVIT